MSDTPERKLELPSQAETLDLVCNEYVLSEKKGVFRAFADHCKEEIPRSLGVMIVAFLVAPVLLIPGILLTPEMPFPELRFTLFLLISIPVILGLFCAHFLFFRELRGFPTNIKTSPKGLSFAWSAAKTFNSECIPWEAITCLSASTLTPATGAQEPQGIVLYLDIDKSYFTVSQRVVLSAQTKKLSYRPPGLKRRGKDILHISFPLDALTLEADKFRLLSAIKDRVPAELQTRFFKEIIDFNKSPTFTQIWLDDMQSFRRQSVLELPADNTLQQGRYKIISKIATGGQAKLYKAEDLSNHNMVALKELILPVNAGADVRNRSFANVKKEAMLLSELKHEGILKLLDSFVEDHRAYLVLEYIEGKTLRNSVQDGEPFHPR
ncbi:MAG: hypothetical protein K2X81_28320, partial [Candidatus Obscuribacterales bacterium]|nr:hypothetical protein [Candidatus Obscuribacterales bacterium]